MRKIKFFYAETTDFWQKMLNFAHSDAEAPPAVFLFHRIFIFKRREGLFLRSRLYFCFAKISIILLISKFLALNKYKRNTVFVHKAA